LEVNLVQFFVYLFCFFFCSFGVFLLAIW